MWDLSIYLGLQGLVLHLVCWDSSSLLILTTRDTLRHKQTTHSPIQEYVCVPNMYFFYGYCNLVSCFVRSEGLGKERTFAQSCQDFLFQQFQDLCVLCHRLIHGVQSANITENAFLRGMLSTAENRNILHFLFTLCWEYYFMDVPN